MKRRALLYAFTSLTAFACTTPEQSKPKSESIRVVVPTVAQQVFYGYVKTEVLTTTIVTPEKVRVTFDPLTNEWSESETIEPKISETRYQFVSQVKTLDALNQDIEARIIDTYEDLVRTQFPRAYEANVSTSTKIVSSKFVTFITYKHASDYRRKEQERITTTYLNAEL